jgi:hypothetical protein
MTSATVTAAIPTFRRAKLLVRAVDSVLSQSWSDVRVLVCDNASDDETRSLMEAAAARDRRVVYHRHERNHGSFFNFQYAVDHVETPYFSILSDDDLLLPDFYRRAVLALEREPDLGFYASQVVLYDVLRGTHGLRPAKLWRPGRHEAGESARLMTDHHFAWTGCVFRREVRDALGPFESVPMGDILFMGKAAAAFPFVVDLRPGALYSETSSSHSQNVPVSELIRSHEVARAWAAGLPGMSDEDRAAMVAVADERLKVVAHGKLRAALESGDLDGFTATADYLEARGDLSPRRRAKIATGRRGGWRFKALGVWSRLQSGYKRRRTSRWRTMSLEEIYEEYR